MRRPSVKAKPATTPKERTKGEVVTPVYVLKLIDKEGVTGTARLLGTTPGTLHKARRSNSVSKWFEVASEGVYRKLGYDAVDAAGGQPMSRTTDMGEAVHGPTSDSVVLLLVQVPRGREAIVAKTVEAIGGTVQVQA